MADTDKRSTGQRRKRKARRYYDLIDANDYEGLVQLFAPDVVYERPGQSRIEGRSALRRFYEDERPLSDGSHEIHTLLTDGETVAVRGTYTGRQDGEPVELGFADFHVFEGDVIKRRYTYTDRDTV